MGEISFHYNVNTEALYEAAFKYWFAESIEYSFAYQRYIAFSDASIFNSPVALTKVATGLSDLYELFVDKKAHPARYYDLIKNFDKLEYNTTSDEKTEAHVSKSSRSIDMYNELYSLSLPYNSYLKTLDDITINDYGKEISIYDNSVLDRDRLKNAIYENLSLSKPVNVLNFYTQYYWLNKWFRTNIIHNINIEKDDGDSLNIYSKIYNLRYDKLLNESDNSVAASTFDNILNVDKTIMLSSFTNRLNIYDTVMGRRDRLGMNIIYQTLPEPKYLYYDVNIVNNFMLSPVNYIHGSDGRFNQKIINPNVILSGVSNKRYVESNVYNLTGIINDKISNINEQLYFKTSGKYVYLNDFISGETYGKTISKFSIEFFDKKKRPTGGILDMSSFYLPDKSLDCSKGYNVYRYPNSFYEFNLDTFAINEKRYCFTIDDAFMLLNPKDAGITKDMFHGIKNNSPTMYQKVTSFTLSNKQVMEEESFYINKYRLYADYDTHQEYVTKSNQYLHKFNDTTIDTKGKSAITYKEDMFADKNKKNFDVLYTSYFINKNHSDIGLHQYYFVDKINKDLFVHDSFTGTNAIKKSFVIHDSSFDIYKTARDMDIFTSDTQILKDKQPIGLYSGYDAVIKYNRSIVLHNSLVQSFKDSLPIRLYGDIWTIKYQHDLHELMQVSLDKDKYYMSIFRQGQSLLKSFMICSVDNIDSMIKYYIPTDFANTLFNQFGGMIIPISKVRSQAYIDNIDLMVYKASHQGYITQQSSASAIPKNSMMQSIDLFCDKESFNIYIDYKNLSITKEKMKSFIFSDEFVEKESYYGTIEGSYWADKSKAESWLSEDANIVKKPNMSFIEDALSAITIDKDTYIYDSLFIDKSEQICYYNYGTDWADKNQLNTNLQIQLQAFKENKQTHMLDCVSPFIKEQIKGFYDFGVFGNKIIKQSDLFQSLNDVHKIAYDTGILPNDFGNWAWVYETPDPFDGNVFGIDELLLPENDTRYENFEDIIFDKENMRPRNPVKVLDNNSFIAKYPTKHPTPDYDDIGIVYIDVETSIMHTVFLKFYRIWQSKIFEFGTMTMVQSVKQMLEYMYSWIMEYFPLDQLEQALRVFRLIRWYGETSVIQNSQYIVTYEYGLLESKLTTGTCLIPNDLGIIDGVTNDTMYIDSTLGVIRNNKTLLGHDAHVTFTISNKKNTTFIFSLSNTVGSVNIYINNVLVDTVSRSALNLVYELPYTGDDNTVTIEKTAANNLNGTFFIGNIKVPNGTFKDLSIDFDPTLKAGNKPLNEIARKMISFANLYENRDEMYGIIRKGNLGVGEIYKRLDEYWKIHHQDKLKGKRLTIKET